MRKIMVAVMVIIAMSSTMTVVAPTNKSESYEVCNLYARSAVVSEVNRTTDIVTVTDYNGNDWQFDGCEDWLEGDICTLTMYDSGTDSIFDDEILKTTYNGFIE